MSFLLIGSTWEERLEYRECIWTHPLLILIPKYSVIARQLANTIPFLYLDTVCASFVREQTSEAKPAPRLVEVSPVGTSAVLAAAPVPTVVHPPGGIRSCNGFTVCALIPASQGTWWISASSFTFAPTCPRTGLWV